MRTCCTHGSGNIRKTKQPQSKRQHENDKILIGIKESHKNSLRAYGSPRVTEDLPTKSMKCGKDRVARLMNVNGIVAKAKKISTTLSPRSKK